MSVSVQLTSEEVVELVAYLDRDPNLPPFLLGVARKLKFQRTARYATDSVSYLMISTVI